MWLCELHDKRPMGPTLWSLRQLIITKALYYLWCIWTLCQKQQTWSTFSKLVSQDHVSFGGPFIRLQAKSPCLLSLTLKISNFLVFSSLLILLRYFLIISTSIFFTIFHKVILDDWIRIFSSFLMYIPSVINCLLMFNILSILQLSDPLIPSS